MSGEVIEENTFYEIYKNGMKVATLRNAIHITNDKEKRWILDREHGPVLKMKEHYKFYPSIDTALNEFKPGRFSLFGKEE